ncbi:MAG: anthranilate synthase component I family protein [Flavobacteriales bacterium]
MKRIEKKICLKLTKEHFFLWANQSSTSLVLDSNHYPDQSEKFDFIIVKGSENTLSLSSHKKAFKRLEIFKKEIDDWIFGYFSYDLKNDTENLTSQNNDSLKFPELFFFQPKKILFIKNRTVTFSYLPQYSHEIESDIEMLEKIQLNTDFQSVSFFLTSRTSKENYLKNCMEIIEKIHLGTVYEMNYCIEFFSKNTVISPINLFIKLNKYNKAPFAVFLKHKNIHVLSNSPERFLKKEGSILTAQPIKGTRKRGKTKEEDIVLIQDLKNSVKDRAENTMIVDLVRNDLSKIAQHNSVHVTEYCKVYTFETVHQMISTIQCRVDKELSSVEIIKANFPMGSMTGAPKINAMKFIEDFEDHKRGIYSGAVGYITPNDDFDFNVVIRSLLYNSDNQHLSLSVGGAITALSNPEEEYEECLTKAQAVLTLLQNQV